MMDFHVGATPMERSHQPDQIAAVVAAILEATEEEADPYLLAGVLIEGVIHVIKRGIPAAQRMECGLAAAWLMVNRLRAEHML